nr:hypothetical protein [Tanacetum cinerariifolium]
SGTLVGQGSAVIVAADTDSLPRMSADLRMACGSNMWPIHTLFLYYYMLFYFRDRWLLSDLSLVRLGFKLFYSNMGTIDSMKSVLIQSTLDALCEKYHIPDVIHPQLPGRNDRIQNSPSDYLRISNESVPVVRYCGCQDFSFQDLDASVNVTRKYLAALQDLLDKSTLAAEIVSQSQLPYPLSPLLLPPHRSMRVVDEEVSLVVRSTVPDPAVLTTSIAITVATSTFVPLPEGVNEPTRASIFADSTYAVNVGPDVVGPSQPAGNDISSKSFYVSLNIDYETLHLTYVTKWDVLNEYVLDKSNVCRSLVDQLAPHLFLSQLHAMEYDQLFTKFNVRDARQTCLSADTEIAGLKAQLSLKEAEVTEAIHLRSQIMNIEAVVTTRTGKLESLKERNASLESVVLTLESEKDKLVDQVSELKATCFGLFDEVARYKLFKEQVEVVLDELVKELSEHIAGIDDDLMNPMLHMDEEFYPRYLRTIFRRRWILNYGLKIMIMKCMQSPEYLAALGGALGHAIDNGMQGGLAAGVDHRKARRGLEEITAYDPSAKANFVFAINALRDLMVPIHRLEDQVIIGETSMSFALDVAHSRVQRLKRNVAACRLSLTDVMVSLLEPLSAKSLTSEASTSGILETAVTVALSTTFVKPTLSIRNHLLKFLLLRGLCLNKSYILR